MHGEHIHLMSYMQDDNQAYILDGLGTSDLYVSNVQRVVQLFCKMILLRHGVYVSVFMDYSAYGTCIN